MDKPPSRASRKPVRLWEPQQSPPGDPGKKRRRECALPARNNKSMSRPTSSQSRRRFLASQYVAAIVSACSRCAAAIVKATQLIRTGRGDLLLSIAVYRCRWRLRGLAPPQVGATLYRHRLQPPRLEAVSVRKPMILSDWQLLRSVYDRRQMRGCPVRRESHERATARRWKRRSGGKKSIGSEQL